MMKIAISRTDGGVSIMTLIAGADAEVCIEQWKVANVGKYVSHRVMDESEIPASRGDRDLWADGGSAIEVRAAPVVVPESVTMRQATQALILAGLDDDVEALLASMPGTEGKLARAEWAKSQTVERNRPLVVQLGAALGLSDADVDQLFITAAGLE